MSNDVSKFIARQPRVFIDGLELTGHVNHVEITVEQPIEQVNMGAYVKGIPAGDQEVTVQLSTAQGFDLEYERAKEYALREAPTDEAEVLALFYELDEKLRRLCGQRLEIEVLPEGFRASIADN